MRYIQTSGDGEVRWEGALEGVGDTMSNILVDVESTAKALFASGYSASVDAAKLCKPYLFCHASTRKEPEAFYILDEKSFKREDRCVL